jgi:citrate lyase synthetase
MTALVKTKPAQATDLVHFVIASDTRAISISIKRAMFKKGFFELQGSDNLDSKTPFNSYFLAWPIRLDHYNRALLIKITSNEYKGLPLKRRGMRINPRFAVDRERQPTAVLLEKMASIESDNAEYVDYTKGAAINAYRAYKANKRKRVKSTAT